jgi:hypothetical protein
VSRGPGRCVRWPRSPRGAGASAARARFRAPWRRSGREPLPPLGPTTSEHTPTAPRSHAGHEAVLALPRALLGLIRPLHRCVPVPRSAVAFRAHHTRMAGVPPACAHEYRSARLAGGDSSRGPRDGSNQTRTDRRRRGRLLPLQRSTDFGRLIGCPLPHAQQNPDSAPSAGPTRQLFVGTATPTHDTEWAVSTRRWRLSLPGRKGRCYSGPTPGPDHPREAPKLARWAHSSRPRGTSQIGPDRPRRNID